MSLVELEISNRVATLTLCRLEALNAINQALLCDFEEALRQVQKASEVAVLITQGSGRAFSAGSDLKELAECSPEQAAEFEYAHGQIFAQLEKLPQITVAAWRGMFWVAGFSWVFITISVWLHRVLASDCRK